MSVSLVSVHAFVKNYVWMISDLQTSQQPLLLLSDSDAATHQLLMSCCGVKPCQTDAVQNEMEKEFIVDINIMTSFFSLLNLRLFMNSSLVLYLLIF